MTWLSEISSFFAKCGYFMYPLAACSLVAVTVVVLRLFSLRNGVILRPRLKALLSECDPKRLSTEIDQKASVLDRTAAAAFLRNHRSREQAHTAVEATAREEFVKLQGSLTVLEVIITIAPLLGLLGTVSGLVKVFSNLGETANTANIANGISEALFTTIVGLAIAVPCVIAHSFFQRKIERLAARMEVMLSEAIEKVFA